MNTGRNGLTQVELIVTLAILGIGFLTAVSGFQNMAKGIYVTKTKSLATNLAQEQIEFLKDKSYFRLRVSTATSSIPGFSPSLPYDPSNYPVQTDVVGGIPFNTYVYVEKVRKNAVTEDLEHVNWNDPDPGLKRIFTHVVWTENGRKKILSLVNLRENPTRVSADVEFKGTVSSTSAVPLLGVTVEVVENPSWRDATNGSGVYDFFLYPGTYTLRASATGYFSATLTGCYVDSLVSPVTKNLSLSKMTTRTISGNAWLRDHLTISRVMASAINAAGFSQEFVEIFNPTTWTWTVNGAVGLRFQRRLDQDPVSYPISIQYLNNTIDPGEFYLFANTSPVVLNGVSMAADAVWNTALGNSNYSNFEHFKNPACTGHGAFSNSPNIIPSWEDSGGFCGIGPSGDDPRGDGGCEGAGALELYGSAGTLDRFGWRGGSGGSYSTMNPGFYESAAYDHAQTQGMNDGEQFYRYSSTSGVSFAAGPAYDSDNNDRDFSLVASATDPPRNNSASAAQPVVSGSPAIGAYVFASDGFSTGAPTTAVGSPPIASYTLTNVATGTWTVMASSGILASSATLVVDTVNLTQNFILTTQVSAGYVSGRVINVLGTPLAGIVISPTNSSANTTTNASGNYFFSVSPGFTTLTANPASANPSYGLDSADLDVNPGVLTSGVDFTLPGNAQVRGRVTSDGTNALPGVPVSIRDAVSGIEKDNAISQMNGSFSAYVATGSYYARPEGEFGETVTPNPGPTVTVTNGGNVFIATYTVGPSHGVITGSVTAGGQAITTGVLLIARSVTSTGVSNPPPAIDTGLRNTATPPYFMASSRGDGTFEVSVVSGTYNLYGWYTTYSGTVPTTTLRSRVNISVSPGGTTPGQSLAW